MKSEIKLDKKYWILMADIIDSDSKPKNELMTSMSSIVSQINSIFGNKILSPLTITLGDEFQGVISTSKSCIDIIIEIEERLLKATLQYRLRYVVLHGQIDTAINEKMAYQMLGSGLTKARKLIEEMKKLSSRFTFQGISKPKDAVINQSFIVYQNIIDSWSRQDERLLASEFITHRDYKIVAEKTNKTRSQIWKREQSLRMDAYFAIKNVIQYLTK